MNRVKKKEDEGLKNKSSVVWIIVDCYKQHVHTDSAHKTIIKLVNKTFFVFIFDFTKSVINIWIDKKYLRQEKTIKVALKP